MSVGALAGYRACLLLLAGGLIPGVADMHALGSPGPDDSGVVEASTPPGVAWIPHRGTAFDGSPLQGELGFVRVPENRTRPEGATIDIAVVRFHTTHPQPGPPVMFLAGGPGASGVTTSALFATHPMIRLLEQCDVIGIDQRGTGLSRPDLSRPAFSWSLPLDRPLDRESEIAAVREALSRSVAYWRSCGLDPAAYNTVESADDVEAVRVALGLGPVMIVGNSYGSHLGLTYLRRHPGAVARAMLGRVEGPDDTWKSPVAAQEVLEILDARAKGDPRFGDPLSGLIAGVDTLLTRLAREPAAVEVSLNTLETATVVCGPYDLQRALAGALSNSEGSAAMPARVAAMLHGDWRWLAASALEARAGSVESPMPYLMDCASGGSVRRLGRIERERQDPRNRLADAIMAPLYPEVCWACGDVALGDAFREPFSFAGPVLLVSGTLDVRTPPANVERLLEWFPRGAYVVVSNAGHESRELMAREYRLLFQAFLRGENVESTRIELPFFFQGVEVDSTR